MAFIVFFIFIYFFFEKVDKTGIIATKFSVQCTPSVILRLELKLLDENENEIENELSRI